MLQTVKVNVNLAVKLILAQAVRLFLEFLNIENEEKN